MSKKTIISAAGLALGITAGSAIAGPVFGDYASYTIFDADSATITATPVDSGLNQTETVGTIYSNMDAGSGFAAFSPATGGIGGDDYTSIGTGANTLSEYKFVGGVDAAGGVLFMDFFDAGGTFVDGFGVQFPQGGNFIWTITITDPTSIAIPNTGINRITADDGSVLQATLGQWFLSDAAPTIGSTVVGNETEPTLDHKFEITVIPAPASMALLGLGGLVATRRRR